MCRPGIFPMFWYQTIPDEMQFSGFDNVVIIENKGIEDNNVVIQEEESVYTSNPLAYDDVTRLSRGAEVTKSSTPSNEERNSSLSLFSYIFKRNDMNEEPSLFRLSSQADASHDKEELTDNSESYDKNGFKRTSSLHRRGSQNL